MNYYDRFMQFARSFGKQKPKRKVRGLTTCPLCQKRVTLVGNGKANNLFRPIKHKCVPIDEKWIDAAIAAGEEL